MIAMASHELHYARCRGAGAAEVMEKQGAIAGR